MMESNITVVNTADQTLFVENMTIIPSPRGIFMRWQLPRAASIIGTKVSLLAYVEGSGSSDSISSLPPTITLLNQFYTPSITSLLYEGTVGVDASRVRPYTRYRIIIRLIRASGLNGVPQIFDIVTPPDRPDNSPTFTLASVRKDAISVTISSPTLSNGPVLKYVLQYRPIVFSGSLDPGHRVVNLTLDKFVPGNWSELVQLTSSGSTITLGSLRPYTLYEIISAAETAGGRSPASESIFVVTNEDVPRKMDAPTIVRQLSGENVAMTVLEWFPEVPAPGVILFYEVVETSGTPNTILYRGNATTCQLPSWSRSVAIRAATRAGLGELSANSNVVSVTQVLTSSDSSSSSHIPTIIGGTVGALAVVAVVVIFAVWRRTRAKTPIVDAPKIFLPPELGGAARRIESKCLQLLDMLGEGKFGKVYKALLDEREQTGVPAFIVAAKVSTEEISQKQSEDSLREAATMAELSHDNIVNVIGYTQLMGGRLVVIVQYCEHGNLLSFMERNSEDYVVQKIFHFAQHVSSGMTYLSRRGFIHRDIAVRNQGISAQFL